MEVGKKEVITPKENSLGNNRFYIINLEDFVKGSLSGMANDTVINGIYSWYLNVYDEENEIGRMNTWETDTSIDFGTGYANTGKIIEIWNKNGTGAGSYEDATQSDYDIFKHIQTKYQEGWYIPSRGEWAAFADSLKQKEDNPLTHNHESGSYVANSGNYNSIYKLSDGYWSSSQYSKASTWIIDFSRGSIESCGTLLPIAFARLGTTF